MKHLFCLIFLMTSIMAQDDYELTKKFDPDNKYFSAAMKSLHFVIETDEIADVDKYFKRVVETYNIPTSAEGCKDGVYTGESIEDAYDFRHVVSITIKDEKIIAVDYNEIRRNGEGKQEDEEYNEEMSVTGTSPSIAYPVYEKALLDKQDIMEVDGVTGATYSLYRFRKALTLALMKARLSK